jgi:hypothetical protein
MAEGAWNHGLELNSESLHGTLATANQAAGGHRGRTKSERTLQSIDYK